MQSSTNNDKNKKFIMQSLFLTILEHLRQLKQKFMSILA